MTKLSRGKLVAAIASATLVGHALIAMTHGGPVAVPDVSAYLSVSQWLAGGILPEPLHFFPGYGVLLYPFSWMDGASLHTAALIVNGGLAACCVIFAAALGKECDGSDWFPVCCALIAALHPSLSTSSRIAWPETLLTLAILGVALLLGRHQWSIAGLTVGLALSVHPRALVLVVAVLVVAVLSRRLLVMMRGLLTGLIVSVSLVYLTNSWPWSRVRALGDVGNGPSSLETLLGQWTALAATSIGLATIGLVVSMRGVRKRSQTPATSFLGVSALGMMIMGGLVLAGSERIDTLLYGRYVDPWVVPLTVVGAAALVNKSVSRIAILTALAPTVVGGLVLALARDDVVQQARQIMTLSLGSLWAICSHRFIPTLFCVLFLGLAGIVVARRLPLAPITVMCIVALFSTVINHRHLHDVGRIADGQAATAELVPESSACLAHDASTKNYALWLYRLRLPQMQHQRVDIAVGEKPCGAYVVAADDVILDSCLDAKRLGSEPRAQWSMWHYASLSCG